MVVTEICHMDINHALEVVDLIVEWLQDNDLQIDDSIRYCYIDDLMVWYLPDGDPAADFKLRFL
jgi:hypothetical protein